MSLLLHYQIACPAKSSPVWTVIFIFFIWATQIHCHFFFLMTQKRGELFASWPFTISQIGTEEMQETTGYQASFSISRHKHTTVHKDSSPWSEFSIIQSTKAALKLVKLKL
jgi:hypothetical protein